MNDLSERLKKYKVSDSLSKEKESSLEERLSKYRVMPEAPIQEKPGFMQFLAEQLAAGTHDVAKLARNPMIDFATNYQEPLSTGASVGNLEFTPAEGETPFERTIGAATRAIPGALAGGPLGIPGRAIVGATMGATSQGLQEAGVNPVAAELATLAGAGGLGAWKKSARGLSKEEQKVAKTLQGFIGEKELPEVNKRLSSAKPYETMAYEPMTAEIAENPSLSQIHRARAIMPGAGIPDKAGLQNKAIVDAFEREKSRGLSSQEIKRAVGDELLNRESERRNATSAGYAEVERMNQPLEPVNFKKFLEEKPAAGGIRKTLNSLKREVKDDNSVSKLAALDMSLNDDISAAFRAGKKKKATILQQAQDELRKDLEGIPLYKETRAKYAELSNPVSEITEHPILGNIPESRLNEVMPRLFDNTSMDNMKTLKNVLGKDPKKWEGIQHATTEYLEKSILNSGAEGKGNIFSYNKLKNFNDKHRTALKEVYNKDQMKFLNELQRALRGQNVAKTLGASPGSDTAAKLAINQMLEPGAFGKFANRSADKIAKIPVIKFPGKGLKDVLSWYGKNRQDELLQVLDRALLEPNYAKKITNYKANNFLDWFDFINESLLEKSAIRAPQLLENTKLEYKEGAE